MMKLTVDEQMRIRIPNAQPMQVFACEQHQDGSILLTPVESVRNQGFTPGSLSEYFTPERDADEAAILSGCASGPE